MDILQKIREIYPSLTRKQKSIADYLLENPEDICYITLAQLSRQTCASEPARLPILPPASSRKPSSPPPRRSGKAGGSSSLPMTFPRFRENSSNPGSFFCPSR